MKKPFALLTVLFAALVVGCGDSDGAGDEPSAGSPDVPAQTDGGPATREALDGRTFTATDAEGVRITKDTSLEIAFEGRSLSVDAGCNSIFGDYALEDGVIEASLASTLIGCPSEQAELEAFVSRLFRQETDARLSGNELSLEGRNGTSLTLED